MTISYKWLCEYLPAEQAGLAPEKLSRILTSIGLEVESMENYQSVKGGLKGLITGEVLSAEKHPNADKLTLTKVNIGNGEPLQIVCGAPNVQAGQKVIVAPVGATIYPSTGDPLTMKVAKIRGEDSYGMICAEDEIGLGNSHNGIMILPEKTKAGTAASEYFSVYEDWIYEIGLTPNRMDAMSHWGVARDVCAYISHHEKKEYRAKLPYSNQFKPDNESLPIEVIIENENGCQRYSGVSISNITVKESPEWLQQKLRSIGLRPINNIVDITNFIQHETGQPLHAFDADKIAGKKIIVKNLPEGTKFITLDEKERKLRAGDLMICDAKEGICIAGVFGGMHSGVTNTTKNIFLESAWFHPIDIRKTSFYHDLRTDAASRFEKGVDISNTVNVLKRAALMIKELGEGEIASQIADIYPDKKDKTEVALKYHYLKKLSGKNYHPDTVKNILTGLGFEIQKEGIDEIRVLVPYHKPDISLPADLVEEILRIDGLDNIDIPTSITITPSVEENFLQQTLKEKTANYLVGAGFNEILTNSITNAAFYSEAIQASSVKMMNSLSAELDTMRPSMLETGLQSIAWNLNRKNNDLFLFEFGRTYALNNEGGYEEKEHLALYITGNTNHKTWKGKETAADIFYLKGITKNILEVAGAVVSGSEYNEDGFVVIKVSNKPAAIIQMINPQSLAAFDIKQPVYYADISWELVMQSALEQKIKFADIPKFPAVHRDLAMVVDKQTRYDQVEQLIKKLKLTALQHISLFDIFESDKLGADKKSLAISLTFLDKEKTLTDKEIDGWMNKIISILEKEIQASIRK